jgi:hypothetical protein
MLRRPIPRLPSSRRPATRPGSLATPPAERVGSPARAAPRPAPPAHSGLFASRWPHVLEAQNTGDLRPLPSRATNFGTNLVPRSAFSRTVRSLFNPRAASGHQAEAQAAATSTCGGGSMRRNSAGNRRLACQNSRPTISPVTGRVPAAQSPTLHPQPCSRHSPRSEPMRYPRRRRNALRSA